MTISEVKKQVAYMKTIIHDDEAAHQCEDNLWQSVLQAIAEGAENPVELAKAALETKDIGFSRWCG